jgi:hypothetical protein
MRHPRHHLQKSISTRSTQPITQLKQLTTKQPVTKRTTKQPAMKRTMKIHRILPAALTAATLALAAPATRAETWKAADATAGADGAITLTDTAGASTFALAGKATLVTDAKAPGGKAVAFDGTQTEPVAAGKRLPATNDLFIQCDFKPASEGANWQTLVTINGRAELRYFKNRKTLGLLVFSGDPRETKEISVKVKPGEWQQVKATIKGKTITLQVGDNTETDTITGGPSAKINNYSVLLGMGAGRPYTGRIASLTVTENP